VVARMLASPRIQQRVLDSCREEIGIQLAASRTQ